MNELHGDVEMVTKEGKSITDRLEYGFCLSKDSVKWDCMRIRTFLSPDRLIANPDYANTFTVEDYFSNDPSGALTADNDATTLDNKDKNWMGIAKYSNKVCEKTN